MKLTKQQLLQIIEEEASSSDIFGKYLFGADRGLPTKKAAEADKEKEIDFKSDLEGHYFGSMEDLDPWISVIDKLEKSGKYTDFLSVPSKYKYAYRVMNDISLGTLTKMLGYKPTQYKKGEIYEEKKNINFTIDKRFHYSWTIDPRVFEKILKDWGNITVDNKGFSIILRAPINASNRFLLNPNKTQQYSGQYNYQREIISVGNIKCDHVWYMPLHNVDRHRLVDFDQKLISHVKDYEKTNIKESTMKLTVKELKQIIKEEIFNKDFQYVKNKGEVQFPEPLDINVNMMPFVVGNPNSLPKYLHGYLPMIEKANFKEGSVAYITVHESFVKKGTTQRRPGIHTDGTNGKLVEGLEEGAWGGGEGGWGGGMGDIDRPSLKSKKKVPAKKQAAVVKKKAPSRYAGGWGAGGWGGGMYESNGIYIASTDGMTKIYDAKVMQESVDKHGGVLKETVANSTVIAAEPNTMYWITDRTPHEAVPAEKDGYRQFIRLVSEEVSVWFAQHNTPNPLGVKPNCPIVDINKFDNKGSVAK